MTVLFYLVSLWMEKRRPLTRSPYDIPIVLLLAAGMMGIAASPDQLRALGVYRAYFLEAIACYYIAVDLLHSRRDVTTFLTVTGAGACLMAVGQIVLFTITVAHHDLDLSAAPSFLNTSANSDALYFEPPLAFALAFTLFPSRPRERWVGSFVFVLLLAALVTALSRASFLAMAVLAAVLVLSAQNPRWRLRAVAAIAVLALAIVEIPFVNQRFLTFADSVTNRESLYRQALQMLSHMPVFGAGISGFPVRVAPYRPTGDIIHLYPHDIWLTTWSEIGLLGVISFGVIFFGLLWRGARALPRAHDMNRPLLWGAAGALILYTVHGLFDSPYWKNDLSVEFWLLAALNVVAVRASVAASLRGGGSAPEPFELGLGDDSRLGSGGDERQGQVKRPQARFAVHLDRLLALHRA